MRNGYVAPLVLATTLALGGCGGSPTGGGGGGGGGAASGGKAGANAAKAQKAYDRINGLHGEERTAELVKCAEQEGALSIYTSNTDIDDLIEGFEDEYDLDVSVYRGNSESVLQRVLQEQKANFFGNDVIETNALELNVSNKEGLLYPYESELRDKARKEAQAEGWTGTRFNVFVVGWNTKLVPKGQEPKSYEELADPKWKGKVSMEVGDVDWFTALYRYYQDKGMPEDEIKDLFSRMAANSKVVKGHTVQGELLSAGQFGVTSSSYSHTIDKAADKGAPVKWRPESGEPVQPVVVRPNGIGLMKAATNPCAAMLFVDWELTGGQEVFEEKFRIGSVPKAGAKDPLEGLEFVAVPEQELLENPKKWDDLYAEVIENGQEVSE